MRVSRQPSRVRHPSARGGRRECRPERRPGIRRAEAAEAAEALRAHELPDRQDALQRLEAELGAVRYAAAIDRGATMSYDEALESTARALDALLGPLDNQPAR